MKAAGFFQVLQPRRWGGYEMDVHTCFEIEMALAEGDMSVASTFPTSSNRPAAAMARPCLESRTTRTWCCSRSGLGLLPGARHGDNE